MGVIADNVAIFVAISDKITVGEESARVSLCASYCHMATRFGVDRGGVWNVMMTVGWVVAAPISGHKALRTKLAPGRLRDNTNLYSFAQLLRCYIRLCTGLSFLVGMLGLYSEVKYPVYLVVS